MLRQRAVQLKLVLSVFACLFLRAKAYTPVVFPSLIEDHGFVYDAVSDQVLSLPGGIDLLLCNSGNENTTFDPAQQPCGDVVVFTAAEVMTLQVLNVSTNGVIQPFQSVPNITTSPQTNATLMVYGSTSQLDLSSVGQLIIDVSGQNDTLGPSAAPEDLDENAQGSLEAMEDATAREEAENVETITEDLPEFAEGSEEEVDPLVLEANETTGFLLPNGRLRPDQTLLLEVRIADLPENQLLRVELDFGQGVRRTVHIYRNSAPASAELRLVSDSTNTTSSRENSFQYEVEFAEFVFDAPAGDQVECSSVRQPLEVFSSERLSESSPLTANSLLAMITAAAAFDDCFAPLDTFSEEQLVRVTGVDADVSGNQGNLSLERLREGRTANSSVQITFSVDLNRRTRFEIIVRDSAGVDLSGAQIAGLRERFFLERRNRATLQAVEDADTLGTSSTVVLSSAVATSVTASVGASMAVTVTGSAATSSAGGSSVGGSVNGAIELLSFGQRIYLMARMAVPNMPENFREYGETFSWTMLDIKVPWRDNTEEQRLYTSDSGNPQEDVLELNEEWPYERMVVTLSWALLLFVGLLMLHLTCIAIFFTKRWNLPNALRFPRLELYYFYWVMTPIAGACATLMAGTENQRSLGVAVLCLIPLPFILWHVYLLMRNFFLKRPENLSVFYEVKKTKSTEATKKKGYAPTGSAEESGGEGPPDKKPEEIETTKSRSVLERFILSPLLGPPYASGRWKTVEGPSNKFVDRYGPIFEEYRHIPGLRRNASYSTARGVVERGHFGPLEVPSWDHIRLVNVIKISGKLLHLVRMIFISCLILGEDDPRSNEQAIILAVVTASYLFMLRFFRPYASRFSLGLVMISELLSLASTLIILYLLNNDDAEDQEVRRRLGIVMSCIQSAGFFLIFFENIVNTINVLKIAARTIRGKFKKEPQIVKVILKAQLSNPRYLERKYFGIWLKNSLGKGIYPGVLKRDKNVPIEELAWVSPCLALRDVACGCCCGREKGKDEAPK